MAGKVATISLICCVAFAFAIDPDFHPEAPCNRAGGICTLAVNCPHEIGDENLGLCPEQRAKGAECCNGVPIHLRDRCKSYGGECVADCPTTIRNPLAKDCPAGQHCCVYRN